MLGLRERSEACTRAPARPVNIRSGAARVDVMPRGSSSPVVKPYSPSLARPLVPLPKRNSIPAGTAKLTSTDGVPSATDGVPASFSLSSSSPVTAQTLLRQLSCVSPPLRLICTAYAGLV